MYGAYKFRLYLTDNQKTYDICKELKELVVEYPFLKEKVKPISIVGIDLGIKDLVITSDGEKYSNPKKI